MRCHRHHQEINVVLWGNDGESMSRILCQTSCSQVTPANMLPRFPRLTYLFRIKQAWGWDELQVHHKCYLLQMRFMTNCLEIPSQYAIGNGVLGNTYLSPLKMRVISHNVKTIKSKNIAWWWAEACGCCKSSCDLESRLKIAQCKGLKIKIKTLRIYIFISGDDRRIKR